MNPEDRLIAFDLIANLDEGFNAYGWVDDVTFRFSASTEFDHLKANGFGIDGFDPAGLGGVGDFLLDWSILPLFGFKN